jgi:hypothetical protein
LAHRYRWTWILGLGILWEWHLVWAALSGMETLLFALLTVFVLWAIDGKSKRGEILGFLVGLGVWIRPDAISLLLPVGWSTLMEPRSSITARMKRLIKVAIGFSVVVIPYLGFNRSLSGAWLPMTFYAKQREYAILLQQPLWERFAAQISVPMVGVGIALAPGMILGVYQIIRDRHWTHAGVWLWVLTYAGLYACRLPTTYQHGRYAMPIVPVVWGLGLEGLICGVRIQDTCMVSRLISKAWVGTAAILTLAFYLLGAQAFAQDVAIIETEMVASAQWIAAHTEPQALVAAHDIGALGYWGQRQLLDLAGLVSPEVIPFLRDEEALSLYLDQQNADYLMTFPGWYPTLATEGDLVFSTNAPYSLEAGGENMAVYEWKASDGNP